MNTLIEEKMNIPKECWASEYSEDERIREIKILITDIAKAKEEEMINILKNKIRINNKRAALTSDPDTANWYREKVRELENLITSLKEGEEKK